MAGKGLVVMFIYLHLVQKLSKTKILKRENYCFKNFYFIRMQAKNLVNFTRNLDESLFRNGFLRNFAQNTIHKALGRRI